MTTTTTYRALVLPTSPLVSWASLEALGDTPVDETDTIRLDRPLDFKHYGGQEYQCEVALLWRSILLRGDVTGYNDRYGGHTMAIGSKAVYRAVGVRAERMGQLNIMARYPFHMHMMYAGGVSSTFQHPVLHHSRHK